MNGLDRAWAGVVAGANMILLSSQSQYHKASHDKDPNHRLIIAYVGLEFYKSETTTTLPEKQKRALI